MASSPGQTVEGAPLLATKRYVPRWRPGLVPRPRLIARLDQGAERKLTLVSAPAGFGKTTLLAEWLAAPAGPRAAGWVSLDPGDNAPGLFWAYVITALQTTRSGIGENALALLYSPQPPPIESVLTTLINEIAAIEGDVALVLDDYHVVQDPPIHEALTFLLDQLPPQLHMVIATREDPLLPLPRLRARGQLTELRAADLRFTPMRAFAGNDRYVVDYLAEEVLQRQPEWIRGFLLQTAILDRLSGPLCDAVTGRNDAAGVLEALERGNLFVVPMDDKRQWYRYHHLFADVLQARLMGEQPDRLPVLHRRASEWCEQNGLPAEAIRHALAAEDAERAASLVELAWPAMHRSYQDATWLGWVMPLPDELVRARPVLSVGYAWALLNAGDLEAGEARLRHAERWLEPTAHVSERADTPAVEMVVVDEREFQFLPATIAAARAFHAGALGDVPDAVKHARRALELSSEAGSFERGRAASILGLAYWASGELEAAYRTFAEGLANIRMAGQHQHLLTISAAHVLAEIRVTQGRLREAARTHEQALHFAAGQSGPMPLATALLCAGLSEIYREWDELDAATRHLLKSEEELGEHAVSREPRWLVARARLQGLQGDLDGALALLDEAERLNQRNPVPDVRPLAALKARVWIAQGRLADALAWARARGLSVDDELSYLREFEHVTLARVLIACSKRDREDRSIHQAMRLLERLLAAAEEGERTGSAIDILVQQALAHEAKGDIVRALMPLNRALTLAEPEGFVRIFVDEGEAMRNLLRHAAARGIATSYTQRLLFAFDESARPVSDLVKPADLAEPLTAREVEILRLIAAGMRNQEIADQLFISLPTVKRHIANAYGKLGVGHRTEAVARANDLNLL